MTSNPSQIGVSKPMTGVLIIIVPFAILGGLMAAINVYRELQRHLDEARARRAGVRAGITTFVFLLLLGLTAAAMMPHVIH